MLELPHNIFPKFICLHCRTVFFLNSYVFTVPQNFSQFRCLNCQTTFFQNSDVHIATKHFSKIHILCCHTSRIPVFKRFYYNTVRSQIQMFVLPHNTLFHIAPVVIRGHSTKYQFYRRSITVSCFTQNKCFEGYDIPHILVTVDDGVPIFNVS
jgi:hypothetical protein